VYVGINEPRQHGAAASVDDARPAPEPHRCRRGIDASDPAVTDHDLGAL
jgi:hypothetical protein